MAGGATLLQRLAAAGRGAYQLPAGFDQQAVVDSVRTHLQSLLNARQGHAPAQMDLGLPSPHDLLKDFPAGQERMQEAVRRCIEAYEPRLREVRISFQALDAQSSAIHFQIMARIEVDGHSAPINFETTVGPEGSIAIDR